MKRILLLAMASALAGCQTVPDNAAKLDVSFNFTSASRCSSVSPAITILGAPAGTAKYSVVMSDKQAPGFNHGGGTVQASGNTIQAGALKSYTGPCPPTGSHDYTISVKALDASGAVVGAGSATRRFP